MDTQHHAEEKQCAKYGKCSRKIPIIFLNQYRSIEKNTKRKRMKRRTRKTESQQDDRKAAWVMVPDYPYDHLAVPSEVRQ